MQVYEHLACGLFRRRWGRGILLIMIRDLFENPERKKFYIGSGLLLKGKIDGDTGVVRSVTDL